MSKEMSAEELCVHCKDAISHLENVLNDFSATPKDRIKKRAILLAYWIKSYVYYLRKEDTFSPKSVFKLKRGCIVQVEFGYRVGRELGGRHYAVVIDAGNSIYRNTVTVVPLSSLKNDHKDDRYSVVLKDGIFQPVKSKLTALVAEAESTVAQATTMESSIVSATPEEKPGLKAIQRQKIADANALITRAKAWLTEILHMKSGSVAIVDQITTISKMRITNPLQKTHPLYSVRLTDNDMDKIDERLNDLYFHSRTKME